MNVTVHIAEAQADQARKLTTVFKNKESWPEGPGFGLPLKGAVLPKAVQVKSV